MLGNGRRLELPSNSDSALEKHSGALQWLEVMLQNPERPLGLHHRDRGPRLEREARSRRHTAASADESGP